MSKQKPQIQHLIEALTTDVTAFNQALIETELKLALHGIGKIMREAVTKPQDKDATNV